MARKKGNMPSTVFIGPDKKRLKHVLMLLRVDVEEDGRPRGLTMIYPEEPVEVQDGDCYLAVYVPEDQIQVKE